MTQVRHVGGMQTAPHHVILIHGINGDWDATWRAGTDIFWPSWLASDISNVCVWSISYPSTISRWQKRTMHVVDRGRNVASELLTHAVFQKCELSFLAHSMGGLVLKQALRTLSDMSESNPNAANLVACVKRVGFLATPHVGSGVATAADYFRFVVLPSAASYSLVLSDPYLVQLNIWYRGWSKLRISHLVLCESLKVKYLWGIISVMIVPPYSSDPGLFDAQPVKDDADHFTIAKVAKENCFSYRQILLFLNQPSANWILVDNTNFEQRANALLLFAKNAVQQLQSNGNYAKLKERMSEDQILRDIVNLGERPDLSGSELLKFVSSPGISNADDLDDVSTYERDAERRIKQTDRVIQRRNDKMSEHELLATGLHLLTGLSVDQRPSGASDEKISKLRRLEEVYNSMVPGSVAREYLERRRAEFQTGS